MVCSNNNLYYYFVRCGYTMDAVSETNCQKVRVKERPYQHIASYIQKTTPGYPCLHVTRVNLGQCLDV